MKSLFLPVFFFIGVLSLCGPGGAETRPAGLSALPSSVRLNPVTGAIFEDRPDIYRMKPLTGILEKNWIFDGKTVRLHAARNEYTAFQAVIKKDVPRLSGIQVSMAPFHRGADTLPYAPELYKEWFVQIKTPSTGYEKSSLGPGWYPDALIRLNPGGRAGHGRYHRSLELPDLHNRVDSQEYLVLYVDQYVPYGRDAAAPGEYRSALTVTAGSLTLTLPVVLQVWDFALPHENRAGGNFQHGGFSRLDPDEELAVYQCFKRHRVTPAAQYYWPAFEVRDGRVRFDWKAYDQRLLKYLSGLAFTREYGYTGPGENQPLELLLLPFDVSRDRNDERWVYFKGPKAERSEAFRAYYTDGIRKVRKHILSIADTARTKLIVFLNGLDESYDEASYSRMVYYGRMFRENFPEAAFRIDGDYHEKTMKRLKDIVGIWCCHSIGYDMDRVRRFRALGIQDWFYGPLLYEKAENEWCGSMSFTDLELNHDRSAAWIAWKYGAAGFCSWGIFGGWKSAWFNPETFKAYYRKGKYRNNPVLRTFNGNAQALYSGGIVTWGNDPSPTLRLKAMRDGVEENEMLRMLAAIKDGRAAADSIVNRIIGRPLGGQSVGRLDVWSHDPGAWDRARIEMGNRISGVQSAR